MIKNTWKFCKKQNATKKEILQICKQFYEIKELSEKSEKFDDFIEIVKK